MKPPHPASAPPRVARGMAQSGVRVVNERAVLRIIANLPGASNADIARASGLGAQTTSRILTELEQRGLIERGEPIRGKRGQPATPLFIRPDAVYSVGIELGWNHFCVVLIDLVGTVREEISEAYDFPDAETVLDTLADRLDTICSRLTPEQRERVETIGLSAPSTLDRNIVLVGGPERQRDLWRGVDPARALGEKLGREVSWFNDGNAACWAEWVAQPRPRPLSMAYFHVGTFIGAGIISEGQLFEGPYRNSANLGSIMVSDRDGKPTFVHQVASLWALHRLIEASGLARPTGLPTQWDWVALESVVAVWIEESARALAKAVVTSQAFLEFDRVIIDGMVPRPILERLIARVREIVDELPILTTDRLLPQLGHLGGTAAAVGAAELPLFRRFFERDWSHVTL